MLNSIIELIVKEIGYWCKPSPCHGDVLIKIFRELHCGDAKEFSQSISDEEEDQPGEEKERFKQMTAVQHVNKMMEKLSHKEKLDQATP